MINPERVIPPTEPNGEPFIGENAPAAEPTVGDVAEQCGVPVNLSSNDQEVPASAVVPPAAATTPRLDDLIGWDKVDILTA